MERGSDHSSRPCRNHTLHALEYSPSQDVSALTTRSTSASLREPVVSIKAFRLLASSPVSSPQAPAPPLPPLALPGRLRFIPNAAVPKERHYSILLIGCLSSSY
jgi:hypothetical protein